MKAKLITFVRGLSNGTPPRFQSYLKSLTLLLVMLLSVNMWGADVTDVITQSCFSNVSSSGYNNYTCTGTSGAGYLINFYQSSSTNMNFKKTTVSSGLVVTSVPSGKKIKSVTATFGNSLNIYWSNTAYSTNGIAANSDETGAVSLTSGTAKSPTSSATTFRLYSPSTAATVSNITIVWTDAAPATSHTVRFYKTDGTYTDLTEASVGAGVTPPTMQAACGDWEFQGWSKTESDDAESTDELTLETLSSGKYYPSSNVTLYPVYTMEETIESDVSDEITQSTTGLQTSGSSGYTAWSSKTVTSDAVYAGQSNKGVSYLQLRNQSPSGIISTSSGGILKKVTVAWTSNNTSGRYVTIFGKKSAYTECANLYNNSAKGTSLGTITYGTSTELDNLNKNDEYTYVGVLASAAVYINKITVTWAVEEDVTYYFSYPSCGPSTYTLLFSELIFAHFYRIFMSFF